MLLQERGENTMQFNITTDYAIRFLLCMGNMSSPVSGNTVAEQAKIPPKYLLKIARRLREAGLLGSLAGAKGGYYLRKTLREITLYEVLRIMEPTIKISRCLEPDSYCCRGASADCKMHRYYERIQEELESRWFSRSLEEITDMADEEEKPSGPPGAARCVIYIPDKITEKEGK